MGEVLGQSDVADEPGQSGDQSGRLDPPDRVDRLPRRRAHPGPALLGRGFGVVLPAGHVGPGREQVGEVGGVQDLADLDHPVTDR